MRSVNAYTEEKLRSANGEIKGEGSRSVLTSTPALSSTPHPWKSPYYFGNLKYKGALLKLALLH
ncbi:MAG TPA: hypothetical protein VFC41_06250 [Anaerovoracaceae bacterium]|nr:hypothetical protein [Anaerovoracaceae bacterium]